MSKAGYVTDKHSFMRVMLAGGFSALDLARWFGVTRTSIYRRINGHTRFSTKEIIAMQKKWQLTDTERDTLFNL